MKELSTVLPGAVLSALSDQQGVTELPGEQVVPPQADELPQGVLDLLATLRVRPPVEARVTGPAVRFDQALPVPAQRALEVVEQGADEPVRAVLPPVMVPRNSLPIPSEGNPDAPDSIPVESALPVETVPYADRPLHDAPMILNGPRPTFSAMPQASVSPPASTLRPTLDSHFESSPVPLPGLLQVPFNKGAVSGQVTVSLEPFEPARTLLLSPSNPQVFDQLKAPFEQLRDPGWRLSDPRGEQQRQGSRQAPDDEPPESGA